LSVESLHRDVDARVRTLAVLHGPRLRCGRGCSGCCVDGLTVFEVEADAIRRHHAELLERGAPHPEGACAFLDGEGACRIYENRPYVCRTQGLPLRWLDEIEAGEVAEFRDICPLNEEGEPVDELPAEACWSIGPVEERLARIQSEADGGVMRRMALRELFRS
jgi:Fe-S-cluster containining protein